MMVQQGGMVMVPVQQVRQRAPRVSGILFLSRLQRCRRRGGAARRAPSNAS